MMVKQLLGLVGAALVVVSAVAAESAQQRPAPIPPIATIKSIRRTLLPDGVRITIETDREVSFRDERLGNPARVFIDLSPTRPAPPLDDRTLRFEGDADVVRQIRIGRHPNNMTRVVLDAVGVSTCSVYPVYDPYRLVIDCIRTPVRAPLASRQLAPLATHTMPVVSPRGGTLIADAIAASAARPAPAVAPTAPATPIGGVSVARQLGLGVSRIVIDPGHGGHDPGAQGKGITEAELVLDVALRLEKLLLNLPGTSVLLTRRTDDFIGLQERTAIANRESADLFLSIHANANSNPQASGVETYFLNFANNLNAASVAARENTASGQTMGALTDFVKTIALNNKLEESRDLASEVQRSLVDRLHGLNKSVKDLGVKQAPFVVLIGASMPSVLAEISFVTNTQEAKLLRGAAYRQRIAEALSTAVQKYQASLKNVATVAHQ
jgi:N-acetylmuramoyl-L-alanine amidase